MNHNLTDEKPRDTKQTDTRPGLFTLILLIVMLVYFVGRSFSLYTIEYPLQQIAIVLLSTWLVWFVITRIKKR